MTKLKSCEICGKKLILKTKQDIKERRFCSYTCSHKHPNKNLLLRNCVNPRLGFYIFKMAFKEKQEVLI
jgi:hypothetical protein